MTQMTIADFINQTTPGHICPFCGNRQWALIGERGFLRPNARGEFTIPGEIDKAFLTECVGCGFVRMIRPYNLIQRIAAQQQSMPQQPPPPPSGQQQAPIGTAGRRRFDSDTDSKSE